MREAIKQALQARMMERRASEDARAIKRWIVLVPLDVYISVKTYGIRHHKTVTSIVCEALIDWLKKDKQHL